MYNVRATQYLVTFIQGSEILCIKTTVFMKKLFLALYLLSSFLPPPPLTLAHQSLSFMLSQCNLKIFAAYHAIVASRRCKKLEFFYSQLLGAFLWFSVVLMKSLHSHFSNDI